MPQKENIGMNKNSKISGNKNRNNKNSSSKNSRENSGNEKKELVWEDEWFRADLDKCGIRLLAKTEESRTALASLVREGGVENHYQAVVSGFMHPGSKMIMYGSHRRRKSSILRTTAR